MRIVQAKAIYQLTFFPRLFPVNCYLVEEAAGLTLIDAAMPFSVKGILKAAQTIGKPITNIVLTHAHSDHVGALDGLKEALPNVPVLLSKRESRILAGDFSLDPDEAQLPLKGGLPTKIRTRADATLQAGDLVGSLLVLDSPGHTPGSISLLDTRSNSLITGDAFQTRGGIAVSGQLRPSFPFPALATWNKQAALESAKSLISYKPSLLAAGHGKMLTDPVSAMQSAIEAAERHLNSKQ